MNKLLDEELNQNTFNKIISNINEDINFKYNSFNIFWKTINREKNTSVFKELIKMSLKNIDTHHLIIYVSNNSSDDTFNGLYKYINIPIVKTDYEHLDKQFQSLIELKDEYNQMVDGVIPKDKSILKPLCVSDFSRRRLHTFILMDDAAFVLKNEKSPWFKWLC